MIVSSDNMSYLKFFDFLVPSVLDVDVLYKEDVLHDSHKPIAF